MVGLVVAEVAGLVEWGEVGEEDVLVLLVEVGEEEWEVLLVEGDLLDVV